MCIRDRVSNLYYLGANLARSPSNYAQDAFVFENVNKFRLLNCTAVNVGDTTSGQAATDSEGSCVQVRQSADDFLIQGFHGYGAKVNIIGLNASQPTYSVKNGTIIGCTGTGSGDWGIHCLGSDGILEKIVMEGNVMKGNPFNAGTEVLSTNSDLKVRSLVFKGNDFSEAVIVAGAGGFGFRGLGGSEILIDGNLLNDCQVDGIGILNVSAGNLFYKSTKYTICNNQVNRNTNQGLEFDCKSSTANMDEMDVHNNRFYGNGLNAVVNSNAVAGVMAGFRFRHNKYSGTVSLTNLAAGSVSDPANFATD